jgi:hypothetical protein
MTKTPLSYFDHYPKYFGQKQGACDVLYVYKDDHDQWHPGNGCHGFMNYLGDAKKLKAVYSSLWCREDDLYEAALDYWGYLLDPETSPFRRALKDHEIVKRPDGKPIAIGIHDMTTPCQIAVPLFMQCRVPQEHSNKLRSYKLWRDHGFEKWEALYLSELMLRLGDGTLQENKNSYTHAFKGVNVDLDKLKNGTPTVTGSSWSNGGTRYTPVNSIWNLKKGVCKALPLVQVENVYEGSFRDAFAALVDPFFKFKEKGIVTSLKAVEILKEKRSEWHSQ